MTTYFNGVMAHLGGTVIAPPRRFALGTAGHAWEQSRLPLHTRGHALLSTANTGPLAKRDQVVVIHDTSVFDYPQGFSRRFAVQQRLLTRALHRRGIRIVTSSEYSRLRLAHHLGLPAERIPVASCGVDVTTLRAKSEIPTFVCVAGDMSVRKNVGTVLRAFQQVHRANPDATLTIVGEPGSARIWSGDERHQENTFVHFVAGLDDAALRDLVGSAWASVFVSHYEGFGLPAVEAQAAGTRCVLSGIDPLRLIKADEDIVVEDRGNSEAVAAAMTEAIRSPLTASQRECMSRRAAQSWSWKQSAEVLIEQLRDVAQ